MSYMMTGLGVTSCAGAQCAPASKVYPVDFAPLGPNPPTLTIGSQGQAAQLWKQFVGDTTLPVDSYTSNTMALTMVFQNAQGLKVPVKGLVDAVTWQRAAELSAPSTTQQSLPPMIAGQKTTQYVVLAAVAVAFGIGFWWLSRTQKPVHERRLGFSSGGYGESFVL